LPQANAIAEAAMDEEQPEFGFADLRETLRRLEGELIAGADNEAREALAGIGLTVSPRVRFRPRASTASSQRPNNRTKWFGYSHSEYNRFTKRQY
jgi:hypothetical protein